MQKLGIPIGAFCLLLSAAPALAAGDAPDAAAVVKAAWEHMRGKASQATVEMVIHRPDWERSMRMDAWTRGESDSLILITAPAKDRGNGTLKKGHEMWTYNPKINRVIKLPPSMMSQSWMGSDFSNNDLAKSDAILNEYAHELIGTETEEGQAVYVIRSKPNPGAPVVWGMQELRIREDHIVLEQKFFDEDLKPVKRMRTLEIQMLGGRLFPAVWKMQQYDSEQSYTLLRHLALEFKDSLPDRLFTVDALKTIRPR